MDRIGISFTAPLTSDEVRDQYIRPLRAALEADHVGFYSNYLRQGDEQPGPPEHLLIFQVREFREGLHRLRMEFEKLPRPGEVQFHNLNPSDPMY